MPSVDVLETSSVATKYGWLPAAELDHVAGVLVLDRFGVLAEVPIRTNTYTELQPSSFIGTRSAFGVFADESLILESDGVFSRPSELVESGDVRKKRYEATLTATARVFESVEGTGLWAAIESIGAIEVNGDIAVRCVETTGSLPVGIKSTTRSGIRFVVLTRAMLDEHVAADWATFVLELGRTLFRRDEEDRLEIPVCAIAFGLWYASARSASGRGFRFAYDSIQHSSYLFVHDEDDPNAGAGGVVGLTAFRRPTLARKVTLSWSDPTINPLVNGFIVSGT